MSSRPSEPCGRLSIRALLCGGLVLGWATLLQGHDFEPTLIEIAPTRVLESGKLVVRTLVTSERIDRVDFLLDGELVASDRDFPFGAALAVEPSSPPRRIEAVALGAQGEEVARDLLHLERPDTTTRVSIRQVRRISDTDWWEVFVEVVHPPTASVEQVDFYREDRYAASTHLAPFRVRMAELDSASYVRVVARFRGGDFAEGVRMVGSESIDEVLAVNMVDVYAMVSDRRGRPIIGLTADDFLLHHGERTVPPDRFSVGDDVPLSVALVLDASGSMAGRVPQLKRAARQFLQQALDGADQALLVQFNSRPRLMHPLTDDIEALASAFGTLATSGGSAIYDAVLFGLLQLEAVPGRKALVVLTDGLDAGSQTQLGECVRLARRVGAPVFVALMAHQPGEPPSHRTFALHRLAERSGGRAYGISSMEHLETAYREIATQLRGQYRLGFSTVVPLSSAELDDLLLSVSDQRLKVRTLLGGQMQIDD